LNDNPNLDRCKVLDCDRKAVLALPDGALKVWLCLWMNENAIQQSYMSNSTIMKQTGQTEPTVSKWKQWLLDNGWAKETGETAADMYTRPTRGSHAVKVIRVDDPTKDAPTAPPPRLECATATQDCANLRIFAQEGNVQLTCAERALNVQSSETPKGISPSDRNTKEILAFHPKYPKDYPPNNLGQDSVSGSVSGLDYGSQLGVDSSSRSRSSSPSPAPQACENPVAPLLTPEPLNPKVNPNDRTKAMGGVAPQTPRSGGMVVLEVIDPNREVDPDFLTLTPETPCSDCGKPIGEYGCGAAIHKLCLCLDEQWAWMKGRVKYKAVFNTGDDLDDNPSPDSAHPSPEERNAAALQALADAFHNHGKKKQYFADGAEYPAHWYRLTSDEKRQMVAQHRKPGKKRQRAAKV